MVRVELTSKYDLFELLRESDLDASNDLQYILGVTADHAFNGSHTDDQQAALAAVVEVANEFGYQLVDRDVEMDAELTAAREFEEAEVE